MADLNELDQICQHSSWATQKDQYVCYDDVSPVCCDFWNKKFLRRNINGKFNVFNSGVLSRNYEYIHFSEVKNILCVMKTKLL